MAYDDSVYRVERTPSADPGRTGDWMVVGPGMVGAFGRIVNKQGVMTKQTATALAGLLEAAYHAGRIDQQRDIQRALGIDRFLAEVQNLSERANDLD